MNTQRAIEPTSHLLGPKEHGRAVSLGLCSLPLVLGLVLVHFRSVGRMRRLCNEREGSLDATIVGPQLLQEPLRVRARRSNACALRRAQEQQVFRPCCAARVVVEYRVEELSLPVPVAPRAPHDVPAVQRQHNGLDAEQHGLVVPTGEQRLDARGGDHARGVLPHVGEQFREHDASDWARSVKGLGRQVANHHGKRACAHREQVSRAVLVVAAPEHRQQQPLSCATHDAPDVGDVAAPHTPLVRHASSQLVVTTWYGFVSASVSTRWMCAMFASMVYSEDGDLRGTVSATASWDSGNDRCTWCVIAR